MIIQVAGFDPSMTSWGIAEAGLDLKTGFLSTPLLQVLEPEKLKTKQIRVNTSDLHVAYQLAKPVIDVANRVKALFVEVPVGSQSARAMCSYGMCVGILGALRALGFEPIEVTATEVKRALSGNGSASKDDMVASARRLYPDALFPTDKSKGKNHGKITNKAEHVADAIGAIHAGVLTPAFQTILRLHT